MGKRKTFGDGIGSGKACILVKEKGLGDGNHSFRKWLSDEGFHLWLNHPNYGMDWVFINLNSMVCAPGMPGIKITSTIREHAITAEEFKVIWGIFMQYEELKPLEMPEKANVKLLLRDRYGTVTTDEITKDEMDRLLLKGEVPLAKNSAVSTILNEWLKNPFWREYYELAPSDKCREMIALEFMYSEYDSREIAAEIDEKEKELTLEDWQHLYRYCGNNPSKTYIRKKIRELGGE